MYLYILSTQTSISLATQQKMDDIKERDVDEKMFYRNDNGKYISCTVSYKDSNIMRIKDKDTSYEINLKTEQHRIAKTSTKKFRNQQLKLGKFITVNPMIGQTQRGWINGKIIELDTEFEQVHVAWKYFVLH